jgi:hypothetical protein
MDGGVAGGNARCRRKGRALLGDLLKKQIFIEYKTID